ncbi:MAG: DMT family transporter [Promethearchaeia archaeon]
MKKYENYLLLTLMIIIWSFSFVVVDISVEYIPPLSVALYRFVIASGTYILIRIYRKIFTSDSSSQKKTSYSLSSWVYLFFASLTGVSFFFYTQYNAIELIGPSLPALFVCLLSPVLISFLALFLFKEPLTLLKAIGFIIASIGGFLLVTGGDLGTLFPSSPSFLGFFFALLTPVSWSIYSTLTKKIPKTNSHHRMLEYIGYLGTLELFFLVVFSNELEIFLQFFFHPVVLLSGLYLGVGCYVVGYYIWQYSQKNLMSSKVASFLYFEPFITLLISTLLQREEVIVIWNILGGVIVLVAVVLINYEKRV